MGKLVRCITSDGLVMVTAIDSTDIVQRAKEIHKTTPVMTAALGRLLTGASIMGAMLKEENASLTLRVSGGGPGGALIAVADSQGNVKGYAENPGLLIMPDENKNLNIKGAVGKDGTLAVMKDYGTGSPYIGQIPLVSGEIAEDLAYYYGTSEQIPTVFALGTHFDEKWNFSRAGGCFIQLLPAADEREIEKVEKSVQSIPPITKLLEAGYSPEEICRAALSEFDVEVLDTFEVKYECNCSVERVCRSIMTLPPDEIETLADDNQDAQVCCHFCEKKYSLTKEQLKQLADTVRKNNKK